MKPASFCLNVEKFIQLHETSKNSLVKHVNNFGILNKWNWTNDSIIANLIRDLLGLDWKIPLILVDSPCLDRYQLPCQLLVNTYIFGFENLTKIPYHQSSNKLWRNLWEQVKTSEKNEMVPFSAPPFCSV